MTDQPQTLDLTKYIDRALFKDGRPHVRGRRMTVFWVAQAAEDLTIDEIMENYTLTRPEVLAALLYYDEHQAEVLAYEEAIEKKYGHYWQDDD